MLQSHKQEGELDLGNYGSLLNESSARQILFGILDEDPDLFRERVH